MLQKIRKVEQNLTKLKLEPKAVERSEIVLKTCLLI